MDNIDEFGRDIRIGQAACCALNLPCQFEL